MDIQDIIFSPHVTLAVKQTVVELCHEHSLSAYTRLVTPTASNDDVNGSQHVTGGGTDFTYRDATEADLEEMSSLGYYEYFSNDGSQYTGHYYNGDSSYFDAVVINPPAYAATHNV